MVDDSVDSGVPGPPPDSTTIRRSIEVEYWVVDETGRLVEPDGLTDFPGVEREFVEPLLEIKTTPCETSEELRTELLERITRVVNRGKDIGKRLVPLATPIHEPEIGEIPSDRTRIQNDVVGENFEYVRHCAGTHIHVEQQPGRSIEQLNTLVALDPALALVNSSPYYEGRSVAVGGRSWLYRWMAYADLAHQGRLWRYVDSHDEWNRRIERRYEEFVEAARDHGVDRRDIVANFDPESAVWTPVQLRDEFNTVEWRSPDTALPSQVLRVADHIATVTAHLTETELRIEGDRGEIREDGIIVPEFDTVLEYLNEAIEVGLESEAVCGYLDRMGFQPDTYDPIAHEIDGREVVDREGAREIRLTYAQRLEEEVTRAAPVRRE
ncbi:glutamate-cysteine ligase family protein [Halomicroarcula sp. GCM10025817]|uniref:glutamate-cysteine ligase family protein n=1 Tax=Haloarcula TaxID=2237 RepID=UPI0023E84B1E|nr:glutamate-cysteine ligase family protein [Halomicroarcula sp. SYNS111]